MANKNVTPDEVKAAILAAVKETAIKIENMEKAEKMAKDELCKACGKKCLGKCSMDEIKVVKKGEMSGKKFTIPKSKNLTPKDHGNGDLMKANVPGSGGSGITPEGPGTNMVTNPKPKNKAPKGAPGNTQSPKKPIIGGAGGGSSKAAKVAKDPNTAKTVIPKGSAVKADPKKTMVPTGGPVMADPNKTMVPTGNEPQVYGNKTQALLNTIKNSKAPTVQTMVPTGNEPQVYGNKTQALLNTIKDSKAPTVQSGKGGQQVMSETLHHAGWGSGEKSLKDMQAAHSTAINLANEKMAMGKRVPRGGDGKQPVQPMGGNLSSPLANKGPLMPPSPSPTSVGLPGQDAYNLAADKKAAGVGFLNNLISKFKKGVGKQTWQNLAGTGGGQNSARSVGNLSSPLANKGPLMPPSPSPTSVGLPGQDAYNLAADKKAAGVGFLNNLISKFKKGVGDQTWQNLAGTGGGQNSARSVGNAVNALRRSEKDMETLEELEKAIVFGYVVQIDLKLGK